MEITLAALFGIIFGIGIGPTIRLWIAQVKSELQADFDKAKATLETQKNDAIQVWQSENITLSNTITSLKADLAAAEAKVTAFKTLFPTSAAPVAAVTSVAPVST